MKLGEYILKVIKVFEALIKVRICKDSWDFLKKYIKFARNYKYFVYNLESQNYNYITKRYIQLNACLIKRNYCKF